MSQRKQEDIAHDLSPLICVYKDGHIERIEVAEIVPPSPHDPLTGVSSKDITIDSTSNVSARLYHPNLNGHQKLPLLVHFHGGGFCIESAFSYFTTRYLNRIVSKAKILAISIEYRQAPEHPLPIAYHDCWEALKWTISQAITDENKKDVSREEWLVKYADVNRVFLGGDSSGANIVHNIAMLAGMHGLPQDVKIKGTFLGCPYFWGSKPVGSEPDMDPAKRSFMERLWLLVSPSSNAGIDDPLLNPMADGAPSLAWLGCERVLVCVTGKDAMIERGRWYCDELKKSGWAGKSELFQVDDEDHVFYIFDPDSANRKLVFKRIVSFFSPHY